MEDYIRQHIWMIPFLPFLGFVFNGLPTALGIKLSKHYVHTVACLVMFLSFLLGVFVLMMLLSVSPENREFTQTLWSWMHIGALKVNIAFLIDPLSTVMILVVTGVGFLIHVYSIGYMNGDPSYARFFTYLNLFCFMMLLLVMGDNLFLLFVGWEGVGLCSYLLIGFWFKEKANGVAGMKAFIVNRVGDFGMMIGLIILFWALYHVGYPTLKFTDLKLAVYLLDGQTIWGMSVITVVCLLFFVGATGKSAQIPLYVWLPDAMAGPTPVSALIHAATMVTAGVYMIVRMNWLFALSPTAMTVVATVGAMTALLGATIGFAQNDIKKVLAYSTVSQLGYMFLALGSGAFTAGIFHLMTHAFFKACLFLGSGSVILGMHHEQDMRLMGGLKKFMPVTFYTFMAATIAISGIVPFSGFFSKDEILWKTFAQGSSYGWYYFLWAVGLAGAMGTAFYMMRCVTVTFFGKLRANDENVKKLVHGEADHGHDSHHSHGELVPHESPKTMTFALVVLALLSVVGGFLNVPYILSSAFGGHSSGILNHFLEPVVPMLEHHEVHAVEWVLMILSVAVALASMYMGYLAYTRHFDKVKRFVQKFPELYRAVYNKYFVDEFYHAIFVQGVLKLNRICFGFDKKIIDGLVNQVGQLTVLYSKIIGWWDNFFVDGAVNLCATVTDFSGRKLRKLQTGHIEHYAYGIVFGVVVILIVKIMFGA